MAESASYHCLVTTALSWLTCESRRGQTSTCSYRSCGPTSPFLSIVSQQVHFTRERYAFSESVHAAGATSHTLLTSGIRRSEPGKHPVLPMTVYVTRHVVIVVLTQRTQRQLIQLPPGDVHRGQRARRYRTMYVRNPTTTHPLT